jgi:hypothetical protein
MTGSRVLYSRSSTPILASNRIIEVPSGVFLLVELSTHGICVCFGVSLLGTAGPEVGDGGTCRVFLKPRCEATVKFD